jgi:primosomal protein N' (replication factor Y)
MPVQAEFAEVILPLAVEGTFTYSIPSSLRKFIKPGIRVLVPFGKKKIYTGVVAGLNGQAPEDLTTKEILDVLDSVPTVTGIQLQLWEWMASYYMCTLGEVFRAALPSGMRPGSESRVRLCGTYNDCGELDHFERLLFEVIRDQGEISLGNLEISGIGRNPLKILQQLLDKGAVEIDEFVQRSSPKQRVVYYRLKEEKADEKELHLMLDRLERAPRQKKIFERFLQMIDTRHPAERVPRDRLVEKEGDASILGTLVRKGILVREEREESGRDTGEESDKNGPGQLNPEQAGALESIRSQFSDHQAVLLQGVTSSGKTELYIHLIREQLEKGKQGLYLLPEIALTEQIITRLRRVFGKRVGVYHSRYSDAGRIHVYRNLLGLTDEEPYDLVVGVRSAIFLPIQDLGLVIIDEEHDHSFKQPDPAPRYHARDTAQILALFHGARVLLGTATPSFESLYNARSGKYGFAEIRGRFGEVEPPEMIIADTREAMKKKQMVSHFTPELIRSMEDALRSGEQVILFRNRRGYSHYIICADCNHIPRCRRCDVSLTYHSISRKLECHYCGHKENIPSLCGSCGSTNLKMMGFGTEKIEEELPLVFPGVRVGRLDTDTAGSRIRTERLLRDFAEGRLDVLVGTQMVSKGLDFGGVSLVGVLDADSMLHFPDFRAFERTFQLVSQVSGRAGRRSKRGKVVLQTMDPTHPVIGLIREGDYETLYREQMEERQTFGYPPYTRMIRIIFRHRVPPILDGATKSVADQLKETFGNRVLGPQYPPVRKVKQLFIKQVILKIEKEASYDRAKSIIGEVLKKVMHSDVYRSVLVAVDVDPY